MLSTIEPKRSTTHCNMPATWTNRSRTASSACTSTIGRSIMGRAAAKQSSGC